MGEFNRAIIGMGEKTMADGTGVIEKEPPNFRFSHSCATCEFWAWADRADGKCSKYPEHEFYSPIGTELARHMSSDLCDEWSANINV